VSPGVGCPALTFVQSLASPEKEDSASLDPVGPRPELRHLLLRGLREVPGDGHRGAHPRQQGRAVLALGRSKTTVTEQEG